MVVLWLEKQQKGKKKRQVSIKLIASLAPARAEIEAGVVAKADQQSNYQCQGNLVITDYSLLSMLKSHIGESKGNIGRSPSQLSTRCLLMVYKIVPFWKIFRETSVGLMV